LALAIGVCSGGSQTPKPDTGVMDAPAQVDTPADMPSSTDTPVGEDAAPDGGVEDAAPGDTAPPTDGPTIECAPVPTGGPTPAGIAPQ